MTPGAISTVERSFSTDEFTDLMTRAAFHLVQRCRAIFCDPAPPASFCFILRPSAISPALSRGFLAAKDAVRELLRPDGSFRDWINLSPVGVTDKSTVLEVDYPERFTNRLLVGELTFAFEPFHLLGPSLPAEWVEGTPLPKVALPRFE